MDRNQVRKRAEELVSKMTVKEKASQLLFSSPAIPRLGIPAYNWWNEALHGVARAGTATVFPQAIALAATFDTELVHKVADAISTEGRAKYNIARKHGDYDIYKGLTFWSPNVNILRPYVLVSECEHLPRSEVGKRAGDLWRGSLSYLKAWH